jgi:hypothetical protein
VAERIITTTTTFLAQPGPMSVEVFRVLQRARRRIIHPSRTFYPLLNMGVKRKHDRSEHKQHEDCTGSEVSAAAPGMQRYPDAGAFLRSNQRRVRRTCSPRIDP